MPETTVTIDRDQRAGLYELVRNHLGSIEDFWIALERTRDFAKAEQLGLEFSEDFRLLQDIGWHPHDERETFDAGPGGRGRHLLVTLPIPGPTPPGRWQAAIDCWRLSLLCPRGNGMRCCSFRSSG